MDNTSSAEKEFSLWLKRPDKTFRENLQFAINAWISADFILCRKYEIVLDWLSEAIKAAANSRELPIIEMSQLVQQRAHPGLVAQSTKLDFVKTILGIGNEYAESGSRELAEFLLSLSEFEAIQDIFRFDENLLSRLHKRILNEYILYLAQFGLEEKTESLAHKKFNREYEAEFFALILKSVTKAAKQTNTKAKHAISYNLHMAQPLTEVILRLRAQKLCFFNDFLELERLVFEKYTDEKLIERFVKLPLHSQLLVMECGIAIRYNVETFMKPLLIHSFSDEHAQSSLRLTIATYTLEMLRKYDVKLSFELNNGTALQFIGNCIYEWVKSYKTTNLREVLMLLCATLRLNPLILEHHIFHLTTWLIVGQKSLDDEQHLFEEYLILLIDMFRRLSQVEKFVGNLLKSLKQWLQNYDLPVKSNTIKRKNQENQLHTPKKRKRESEDVSTNKQQTWNADEYLQILFSDFNKVNTENRLAIGKQQYESFPELRTLWPTGTVGIAFTRLVSGLVSKPSIVIWKTVLYNLKELLDELPNDAPLTSNQLFLVDLHSALLCEYLSGCKLVEQYNLFGEKIDEQRNLTATILNKFGRYLLACEYNKRIVRAFIECTYSAKCFELILAYYQPDTDAATEQTNSHSSKVHSYLTIKEWTLLQQRVLNFGSTQCKYLFNRLQIQEIEANVLLDGPTEPNIVKTPTVSLHKSTLTTLSEPKQLQMIMQNSSGQWLENHLQNDEKLSICKTLLANGYSEKLLTTLSEDAKALQFLVFSTYEILYNEFLKLSKNSLLANCQFDFTTLYEHQNMKQFKQNILAIMSSIKTNIDTHCPSQLPMKSIQECLELLKQLPISYMQEQSKSVAFAFQLALYCDLKASDETDLSTVAFNILTDMLYLGPQVPIFKYLDCIVIQKLFPVQQYLTLYEKFFVAIKNEEKGSERFLVELEDIIKNSQELSKLSNDERSLMLMAVESLASMTGPPAKRMRKHLLALLETYKSYIQAHFHETNGEQPKKDKKFVSKTISGFAAYANATLTHNATTDENKFILDDEFRRIFKIYIGYSLDYRDSHGVRLVQVALNHRQQLNFAQNEIEFTLSAYWTQLNANIKETKRVVDLEKSAETVVKLIVAYKTNEDFLIMLKNIANMLTDKDFISVVQLLTLIAKCPFSTVKAAIFNEQCKQIINNIDMQLTRNELQLFTDEQIVIGILACQLSIVENKMLPLSLDLLDSILSFLIDINIKRFKVNESNISYFTSLYMSMTELCIGLIKYQHILLVDRVAQFMHIFKDLVRAIVWYKCDRESDTALTSTELDKLSELAMKLESLMHLITNHSVSFKRISPFIITFVINLMVAEKRTTTLYPKIKKHIDSICYDLIGLCDNRVGGFILRCSNEASRQVYETFVKNHNKYHKFKGKV